MFDTHIVEIMPEIRVVPLGKHNLIILRIENNLSDKQYAHLKDQLKETGDTSIKFLLIEGGVSVDTVLTDTERL